MRTSAGCFKFCIPAASYTVGHNVAGLDAAIEYSASLCTMEQKTKANYIIILLFLSLYLPIQFHKDQNTLFSLVKISWILTYHCTSGSSELKFIMHY